MLKDKPGISIMADRGFTVKDMLKELNVELNIPPFLDGRQQLPLQEVQKGRKSFPSNSCGVSHWQKILKGKIPLSVARKTNQIV